MDTNGSSAPRGPAPAAARRPEGHWTGAGHTPISRVLIVLFFMTIVFDFRRTAGDTNPFVAVMGLANLLLGAWYVATSRQRSTTPLFWLLPFLLFAWMGTFVGLLNGQETYDVVSRSFPTLVFCMAVLVIASQPSHDNSDFTISLILLACVLSSVIKFVLGFVYYDLNLENVRYQVASGSLPLLFSFGLAGFLVGRKRFSIAALALALAIILVSVTRSYVLAVAVSVAVGLLCERGMSSRKNAVIVTLVGGLPVLLGVVMVAAPVVAERWIDRLFGFERVGFDLTGVVRLAEMTYQLRRLEADAWGLWFGFGHAAVLGMAGEYRALASSILGSKFGLELGVGSGHNFYLGLVYTGGLVCAVPMIAGLIALFAKAIGFARRFREWQTPNERFALVWGTTAMAAYLVLGFLGGLLGDRSTAFFFGASIGLIFLGSRASLRPARTSPAATSLS